MANMKNKSILLTSALAFALNVSLVITLSGQDVGIGTSSPDYRLHVCGTNSSLLKIDNTSALNTDINADLFFKTGQFYTAGIKTIGTSSNTARLGLFTYALANSGGLLERMSILDDGKVGIGTITPGFILDVNGRIRLRSGGGSAGLYLMNAANTTNNAFIGMYNDQYVGLFGGNGAGWDFVMNTTNGNIGIGTVSPTYPLDVRGTGYFKNELGGQAVIGQSVTVANEGTGVFGEGGAIGVQGYAHAGVNIGSTCGFLGLAFAGTNCHGIYAKGEGGYTASYGIEAVAIGGASAYGIYAEAIGSGEEWGGYFVGDIYSSGTYQGSDRKLKNNIQPVSDAIKIIEQLKPSKYDYRTTEYKQMQLPEGQQYGLIADELKLVLPALVKSATQPAQYENNDDRNGRVISAEVKFEAVNYTALIPILIGAIQEQQVMIEDLQRRLDATEGKE
jgi:hypothetical protein